MDPVSALGVAAAACQFAGLTANVADGLYSYYRKVRQAPKLSKELRKEALLLSDVLEDLKSTLPADVPIHSPSGPSGALSNIVNEFAESIKKIAERIEINDRELSLKRLKWPFTQEENETYFKKLERFKSSFQLVLQTVQKKTLADIDLRVRRIDYTVQDSHQMNLDASRREREEKRLTVLNWVYSDNFDTRHTAIAKSRVKNTGDWFLKSRAYCDWFDDPEPSIILCHGMPGAGKSVIMSRVVDELIKATADDRAFAYIYFDYNDTKSQLLENVIRSLLKQLLLKSPLLPPELEKFYDDCSKRGITIGIADLRKHLISACSRFQHVIVLFDALDECATTPESFGETAKLSIELRDAGVKVFCTSRIRTMDVCEKLGNPSVTEIRAAKEDVTTYVLSRLDTEWEYGEEGKERIADSLVRDAQGKFLLVRFQLDYILSFLEPDDAIEALSSLPPDMYSAYDEIFNRIKPSQRPTVIKVISWLFHARRPLHKRELQEAIGIRPNKGQIALPKYFVPSDALVRHCQGLITIDDDAGIVRFTHFTVQEFLNTHYRKNLLSTVELAKACLTYLTYDIFESGPCPDEASFEQRKHDYRLSLYAAEFWGGYTKGEGEGDKVILDCLRRLLGSPKKLAALRQFQLLAPRPWWDLNEIFGLSYSQLNSWRPIHSIAREGLSTLCKSIPVLNGFQGLEFDGGTVSSREDYLGTTPLLEAAKNGHLEMAIELIKTRADVGAQDNDGRMALHWSAGNGHKDVVIVLLEHGADVGAQNNSGWTALHLAAWDGHKDVVIVLLEHGADVGAQDNRGSTALHRAAINGHKDVVIVLLEHGADVGAQGEYGWTALHSAAIDGHKDVVIVLLEHGADMGAQDNRGSTALHRAAINGHRDVVIVLLEHGADVGAQGEYGWTALHWAAINGHKDVVIVLLEHGADEGAQDNNGWTALDRAAWKAHKDVVIVLLETLQSHGKPTFDSASRSHLLDFKDVLKDWLAKFPDDALLWFSLGNAYFEQRMYQEATASFDFCFEVYLRTANVGPHIERMSFPLLMSCTDCYSKIEGHYYKCKECYESWNHSICRECIETDRHLHSAKEVIMIPSEKLLSRLRREDNVDRKRE